MASKDLFTTSPIPGIKLFSYPLAYKPYEANSESRLPIGKHIEEQLLKSLEEDDRYTVIAYGLQVQHEGITLGELDFIIKDHEEEVIFHLELVHKFYIYDELQGDDELNRWTGPNYKDKLVYKLDKLENHQFPLLHHPSTLPYLKNLGLDPSTMEQRLCFKAECYIPIEVKESTETFDVVTGRYLHYANLHHYFTETDEYHICSKQEWIMDEKSCSTWTSREDLLSEIALLSKNNRAIMTWIRGANEINRFMVLFS
jgi:hypothetical protein